MKPGKYLVVNGDDFGVNLSHNLGVIRAYTEGILTTAGIIACSPWFRAGIELARKHGMPIGVHLALSCEYPFYQFGPLTRAPELSAEGLGYVFPSDPREIDASHVDAVTVELRAQVQRVLDAGVTPTHMEGHMGCVSRDDGAFAESVDELSREFGIPYNLRKKDDDFKHARLIPIVARPNISTNIPLEAKKDLLMGVLESVCEGINWLGVHAAEDYEEMDACGAPTAWGRAMRATDMQVLCDPDIKRRVQELDIQLINAQEAVEVAAE